MLVDSDLERQTLQQLRSLQSWLQTMRGIALTIEKPLFDLGPPPGEDDAPRPPCIPDFIVRAPGVGRGGCSVAIVETMGFADEAYRERKVRMHAVMRHALGGAPLIAHEFHEPPGQQQSRRDSRFWQELRWIITGPETASAGRRPAREREAVSPK